MALTPREYRSYVEHDLYPVLLEISSYSKRSLLIDQSVLRELFSIEILQDGASLPVLVRWRNEVIIHKAAKPTASTPTERLPLEPLSSLDFLVGLERQDGLSFTAGRYQITWRLQAPSAIVSAADGTRWKGATGSGRETVFLTVRSPVSPFEIGRRYLLEAEAAARREDYRLALGLYGQAADADPANASSAMFRQASMHLLLAQYREAVQAYERALDGREPNRVAGLQLALAYMGLRDEVNAARVLRAAGTPEEQVTTQISEMRTQLANIPRKTP